MRRSTPWCHGGAWRRGGRAAAAADSGDGGVHLPLRVLLAARRFCMSAAAAGVDEAMGRVGQRRVPLRVAPGVVGGLFSWAVALLRAFVAEAEEWGVVGGAGLAAAGRALRGPAR
jgi:hypothetical protein